LASYSLLIPSQGGDATLGIAVSSNHDETPVVTFASAADEVEVPRDGDTISDTIMDFDDEDASTVVFASAIDEGEDFSLGFGIVSAIHCSTTPNSFFHRMVMRSPWISTTGRRLP